MERVENTLILPEFKGVGSEYLEQHLFVCETIWAVNNIQDEGDKIAQLETNFRGHALEWYMKLQSTIVPSQPRILEEIT
jgi:hypothetical protein